MTTAKKPASRTAAKKTVAATSPVEEAIEYQIGIRELRQDASRVLALVEAGASITITRHGKPVAIINPPKKTTYDRWVEEGKIIPAKRKIDFRNWEPKAGPAPQELIEAARRELRDARF